MHDTLDVQSILALTDETPIDVTFYYPQSGCKGQPPHKPEQIMLHFPPLDKQSPGMQEALAGRWEALTSHLTEVPVSILGTRISHPSGSLDGNLAPAYQKRLPAVNEARAKLGLDTIY